MRLIPKQLLLRTGPVDEANWNYRPVLGAIQRKRFKVVMSFLSGMCFGRLLEVGYGSGIFLPQLSEYCNELYGIDIHRRQDEVTEILRKLGVEAHLQACSAADLPFGDDFFDCIVAVSALEFIDEIRRACAEMRRVLRPHGMMVVVTPGRSWVVDSGLRLLTGKRAAEAYRNRRDNLLAELTRDFVVSRTVAVPRFGGRTIRLYAGLSLIPKK
jgi:ubiquinone/menaquinone biosynthesis C-methylase UbiE